MKIGLVQFSQAWENIEENKQKILQLLDKTSSKFNLLVFPEMTLTGFTMKSSTFAEDINGTSFRFFIDLASKLKTNIFAGIIEKDEDKIFNSLIHFDENGLIKARYRKIHPYSKAEEDKYYNAGNDLVVTEIGHHNIGLTVCYDLRFPELYRMYSRKDISAFVNIANWPVPRIEHWDTLLKARAIENQSFVIGVNRVGIDSFNNYNGHSSVYDSMGKRICFSEEDELILECELNFESIVETRTKLPFLIDMKLI